TAVTDHATLGGSGAATATGTVTYTVYGDSACSSTAGSGGTVTVTAGAVPASSPVTLSAPGTYYWEATYSGAGGDAPTTSTCGPGDEVETVGPPVSTPEAPAAVALPVTAAAIGVGMLGLSRRRRRGRRHPV
ncbi:MAG TPA: hypothetical protein VMB72_07655, partial [Acidimicrobiales bacterium]|nr:hypothetical protein [Acidimicrobiales bacterium]